MCGRYAASRRPEDLVEEFDIERLDVRETLATDYNVAPTKPVYAVLERPSRDAADGAQARRRLTVVRWGLVPWWAKDVSIGSRLINARMETVADKPAFREAFATRRCLLPADGYFEWYVIGDTTAKGRPKKQPFYITPADGGVLAMAGIYDVWRDRKRDRDDPEAYRWTCAVLTTRAEDALGKIHDRMPLLVEPVRYSRWLDSTVTDSGTLLDLLVPAAPGRLQAYPVDTLVNDVRNNGPELVEPLAPDLLGQPSSLHAGSAPDPDPTR
jgi:putative SOS response-associated peptidase YedK